MAFAWVAEATLPVWPFQFNQPGSSLAVDLTSATLALVLRSRSTGTDTAGGGTWTARNNPAGQAIYNPVPADTQKPGVYEIRVSATWPPVNGVAQVQWWSFGDIIVGAA